jgi:hypothetical protein
MSGFAITTITFVSLSQVIIDQLQVFAGTGEAGYNGDSYATQVQIAEPLSIFVDSTASYLYFADVNNNRVRQITISYNYNYLTTIAGNSGNYGNCVFV